MSLYQGPNFPQEPEFPGSEPTPPKKHKPDSFPVILMTPHALELVNDVIDRSADFDRTLAETDYHPEVKVEEGEVHCPVSQKAVLLAYGELTRAKGKLVAYIARLMDRVADPNINRKRSEKVRFE